MQIRSLHTLRWSCFFSFFYKLESGLGPCSGVLALEGAAGLGVRAGCSMALTVSSRALLAALLWVLQRRARGPGFSLARPPPEQVFWPLLLSVR